MVTTASSLETQALREFGDSLKLYKLTEDKATYDELDIVRTFRAISAEKARSAIEVDVDESEFQNWNLEVKLWDLCDSLLKFRYADKVADMAPIHKFNSDVVYQEKFFQSNPQLCELWLMIQWIQMNFPDVERPQLSGSKWFHTQMENSLESFDSDAPLRSQVVINASDLKQEDVFYEYVFKLILSGKYKEASQECESTQNWTMKMILAGVNNYFDPVIDKTMYGEDVIEESTHGIKKKALWRSTVHRLSKSEQLNKFERAIYGYISGDLSPLEVSTSWDMDLLIYLNHIITNEVERHLIEEGKIPKDDLIVLFPKNQLSVQDVINAVFAARVEEGEHPLCTLMAAIITKNIPSIVSSSVTLVRSIMLGEEGTNEIVSESYLLRVVTHLVIFLSIMDPEAIDSDDRSKIISTYIWSLKPKQEFELIPLYVSFLPEVQARDTYSLFLLDLYQHDQRIKQLELSRLFGLPLENILKRTVERCFMLTEQHYSNSQGVALRATDETDLKLMSCVEYFVESRMFIDAIHASTALYRRFLLNGRTQAAHDFCSRVSITQLLKQYDVGIAKSLVSGFEREEVIQYDSLMKALDAIHSWNNSPKPTSSYAYVNALNILASLLKDTIVSLFAELSTSGYEKELIHELRVLYIPHLIMSLHQIYLSGGVHHHGYVHDALELTNLVASESTKFYTLFQSCDKLNEYLGMVAHCAAVATEL